MTATYSPEDNKLRLYPSERLPRELYDRVKSHGFSWAPKQELFVAPMWTPERADLLLELCGEIGDEDTSLVERAEDRAERFEDYSEKRLGDAERAKESVAAIADNIPLGQPILVGHHSEKRARKDAEKIENGMRRAVKMWETSKYWQDRAKGAVRAAKYKERPDVRARRIKKIEADKRKQERNKAESERALKFWNGGFKLKHKETGESRAFEIIEENRERICNFLGCSSDLGYLPVAKHPTLDQHWHAWDVLRPDGERYRDCPSMSVEDVQAAALAHYPRLIERYDRWIAHYDNRLAYERAMLAEDGGTATDRVGPEVGGACKCWASHRGGFSYIKKVNRVSLTVLDNWGNDGDRDDSRNFTRNIPFDKCFQLMTAAQVQEARGAGLLVEYGDKTGFAMLDEAPKVAPVKPEKSEQEKSFEQLKESAKAGVQVVSAPQLFPTPPELAKRMVYAVGVHKYPPLRILEPSAGTGNLIAAILAVVDNAEIVAVEINNNLAEAMKQWRNVEGGKDFSVLCADFLQCNGDLGKFDRIVMNPPFENGSDIKHILHARTFLNPGGKLVAICANGSRQREQLMPIAAEWIDLEPGSFANSGTNVNAAIVVITQP